MSGFVQTQQETKELLQSHGVYPTAQRLHIAYRFLSKPQHLNADQIQELVNQGGAKISKATVYNTLSLFVERGLVREIIANPSKVLYDSNTCNHHHIYNADTGELIDFDMEQLDLAILNDLPEGVAVERVNIVIQVRQFYVVTEVQSIS